MIVKGALVTVLCMLCVLAGGCSRTQSVEPLFSTVTVSLEGSPEKGGGKTIVVKDQSSIKEAVSFFPGLTETRTSRTAGGWYPHVRFTFAYDSGKTITVISDYRFWNKLTGGHFEVKGDLEAYVKDLFAEADPQSSSQE